MSGELGQTLRPGAMLHVVPALLSTFLIFYLGTAPGPPLELPEFDARDKVGHLIAFGFLQFTHQRALRFLVPQASLRAIVWWSIATASVVGAALEVWQATLPYRTAEWGDLVADVLGALLVGAATYVLGRKAPS